MTEAQGHSSAQDAAAATIDRRGFVTEMRRAMQLHEAGKLSQAADAYARALACHPDQPEALNYSGYLAHQLGDSARGLDAIRRSIALDRDNPHFISNLAKVQQALGRSGEAAESYRRVLALNPTDAQAQFNLGIVLQEQGELREAQRCFKEATRLTPDDPRPIVNLAHCLRQQGRLRRAARLYTQAAGLDPDNAALQSSLGYTFAALGQLDKAELCYRRSLALDPDNAVAQAELGALLAARGQRDAAVAACRRALEIDPACGIAYLHLGAGKRFQRDDPDLAAMEALLSDPELSDGAAVALHFALGKAHDDLGSYDVAFRQFAEGNRLMRGRVAFDPGAIEVATESILDSFGAALLARNRGAGSDSELPIFVVGLPQSGKALVEAALGRHPRLRGARPATALRELARQLPQLAGAQRPFPACVAALPAESWCGFAETYLKQLRLTMGGAARGLDGTATGFRLIGLAHLMLPRARIVHCRRDPLDSCLASFFTLPPAGLEYGYDLEEVGLVHRLYRRCMAHWQEVLPERLFELDYEALLTEPRAELGRLLEHCGLDWDEACLTALPPAEEAGIGHARNYEAHLAPLKAALGQAR